MRLGGDEDGPPDNGHPPPTDAYPSIIQRHRRLVIAAVVLFLLLFFRSSSRDYQADAESYLRSVGRENAIESIMPKSESAKAEIAMSTRDQVIALMKKSEDLEIRVKSLEAAQNQSTVKAMT
mmetsp:Transcript_60683/g.121771  ORF Transcript_60683/g.121771 Transcript_60683/m.121771 type:complete len:122 (+) Transcript_60683:37-402(+)